MEDLIFYTAKKCAPCRVMEKKLDSIKNQLAFKIKKVYVDDIEDPSKIDVFSTPAIKIVKNGTKITGDVDLIDLRNILMRNLYR
ncbi:MAG: thioredoxin domain-containing protein [Candidatus Hodarchaeota archaeon]